MDENVPEECPGVGTEESGKASACEGCPNQKICASAGPAAPDPDIDTIAERLSGVKHKVLILSGLWTDCVARDNVIVFEGKGGVGKSTVTANLARCLATTYNKKVGVLDIDLCGPSQPTIMGCQGESVHQSGSGWSPVFVDDNLSLMSAGFLLPTEGVSQSQCKSRLQV